MPLVSLSPSYRVHTSDLLTIQSCAATVHMVSHSFTSSGWTLRSCLISCMEYTTSPPHLSSPRPTYHGCDGVILTPYIHAPHSTPSISSSSDPDVTSLTAPPFPWAARGLLAWGLEGCLTRLRTPFVSFEETRVTPFFPSHPVHVTSCFLFHSLYVNPACSLRTLHFLYVAPDD